MLWDWIIGCRECGTREGLVKGYCPLCWHDKTSGAL